MYAVTLLYLTEPTVYLLFLKMYTFFIYFNLYSPPPYHATHLSLLIMFAMNKACLYHYLLISSFAFRSFFSKFNNDF